MPVVLRATVVVGHQRGVDHHSVRYYYFILRHILLLLALSRERKNDIRFSLNDKGPDRGSPWIVSRNSATLTCGHVNNVCQDYQRGARGGLRGSSGCMQGCETVQLVWFLSTRLSMSLHGSVEVF